MAPRRPHHDQYRSSRTSSRTHEQHGPASDHQRTRPGSPDPFHSDPGEDSDTDSYYAPGRDPRYWESEASDDDHIPVYDFELDNAFSKARPPRAPRVPRPAARSDGSQSSTELHQTMANGASMIGRSTSRLAARERTAIRGASAKHAFAVEYTAECLHRRGGMYVAENIRGKLERVPCLLFPRRDTRNVRPDTGLRRGGQEGERGRVIPRGTGRVD